MDLITHVDHLPQAGETVLGNDFRMITGGKGANQATAAARIAADASSPIEVQFLGAFGSDHFGEVACEYIKAKGVKLDYATFRRDQTPTGVALIYVDKTGQNCIGLASNANATLQFEDCVPLLERLTAQEDIVLLQLEIPLPTVEQICSYCSNKQIRVILDPAPAQTLSRSILRNTYLITPNESEAAKLVGVEEINTIEAAHAAAEQLQALGARNVAITLGNRGAVLLTETEMLVDASTTQELDEFDQLSDSQENFVYFPAFDTGSPCVDATGAGDYFNAAISFWLVQSDKSRLDCAASHLENAVKAASTSAAFFVTQQRDQR